MQNQITFCCLYFYQCLILTLHSLSCLHCKTRYFVLFSFSNKSYYRYYQGINTIGLFVLLSISESRYTLKDDIKIMSQRAAVKHNLKFKSIKFLCTDIRMSAFVYGCYVTMQHSDELDAFSQRREPSMILNVFLKETAFVSSTVLFIELSLIFLLLVWVFWVSGMINVLACRFSTD